MRKWDAFRVTNHAMMAEALEQLIQYSEITRYNIRSTLFPLEGVRIPAYEGFIVIKVKGPQALVNLANVIAAGVCRVFRNRN